MIINLVAETNLFLTILYCKSSKLISWSKNQDVGKGSGLDPFISHSSSCIFSTRKGMHRVLHSAPVVCVLQSQCSQIDHLFPSRNPLLLHSCLLVHSLLLLARPAQRQHAMFAWRVRACISCPCEHAKAFKSAHWHWEQSHLSPSWGTSAFRFSSCSSSSFFFLWLSWALSLATAVQVAATCHLLWWSLLLLSTCDYMESTQIIQVISLL